MSRWTHRLAAVTRHPVSFAGAVLATVCAAVFLVLLVLSWFGRSLGPYIGLLTFVALPAGFVLGLLLLPVGLWWGRASRPLPVIDLGDPRWRHRLLVVAALTVLNLALVSVATYEGVHVLESNAFCGTACHEVMEPQATAFRASPHAAVGCADCHVGAGAEAFFAAKLNGASQLAAVLTGDVPRPIPPPPGPRAHGSETCTDCHDPAAWVGDRLAVFPHTLPDDANKAVTSVLWLHVGGARGDGFEGIHWHADPRRQVRYRTDDDSRALEIQVVEVVEADGTSRRWTRPRWTRPEEPVDAGDEGWRTLTCSGCHNRVGHPFAEPGQALDAAFEDGRLPREVPDLRRLSETVLAGAEVRDGVAAALAALYAEERPEVAREQAAALDRAGKVLGELHAANVFPAMGLGWGFYPDHRGHERSPGCFRCHDDSLTEEATGEVLAQDCFGACHVPVAMEEEDPAILAELEW